jgi:hypothetical protein
MITLPRGLARTLRAVLRRSVVEQGHRTDWPVLVCRGGPHGLLLQASRGDVGVGYHLEGAQSTVVVAFRSALLAEFEGKGDDPVTLEPVSPDKARVRWQEAGVPRVLDVETVDPETVAPLPAQPTRWAEQPGSFCQALLEAAGTTARASTRYSLSGVLLCGSRGQVIATDGRQLLLRGGFNLPWQEDLLVPRLPALGLRELRAAGPVGLCRTEDHVALRLGAWTFFLGIDRNTRFPDVRSVIPRPSSYTCRLRLDPDDASFLARALPGLPGADDEHAPVTLHLTSRPLLRARGQGEAPATELELARSSAEGKPVRICCNRLFLRRALALGFRELHVVGPAQPAAWRDGPEDVYLFVPLEAGSEAPAGQDAVRATSVANDPLPAADHHPDPEPEPEPQRRYEPMPEPAGNGHNTNGPPDHAAGLEDLIAETEGLRRALQEAAARAGRLAGALRQQRRRSRAVQAAVEALRGLKLSR